MATHSSVLAWRVLGTAEPSGLLSMGSHRVRHDQHVGFTDELLSAYWGLYPYNISWRGSWLMTRALKFAFGLLQMGFPGGSVVKNPAAGDAGQTSGSGRTPGEGNGNPLQYSCMENSKDRGAWQATVHGMAKASDTTEATEPPCFSGRSFVVILKFSGQI